MNDAAHILVLVGFMVPHLDKKAINSCRFLMIIFASNFNLVTYKEKCVSKLINSETRGVLCLTP